MTKALVKKMFSPQMSKLKMITSLLVGLFCFLSLFHATSYASRYLDFELFYELGWGGGEREVGRLDGHEAASEGPMSFYVTKGGESIGERLEERLEERLYVLDQVNMRVVRHDVHAVKEDSIVEYFLPGDTFQDLLVTGDGHIIVMDRLVRSSLLIFSPDGSVLDEIGLLGRGIPKGGGITGMFEWDGEIWVEYGHLYNVRVLDTRLLPCNRIILPGRRFRRHLTVNAGLDGMGGVEIWLDELWSGLALSYRDLFMDHDINRIIWLESDEKDRIHIMFHLLEFEPTRPWGVVHESTAGVVLDENLNILSEFASPFTIVEHEQFREFQVTSDGSTYQMVFVPEGVKFLKTQ